MSQVECVYKNRLLAEYETELCDYAMLLNKTAPAFDFGRTVLLRSTLDRMEEEITKHCVEHGCDPAWVQAKRGRG